MARKFFILGCQRTGTTLMKLILESHPDVYCYDEHLGYRVLAGRRLPEEHAEQAGVVGFKVPRLTEQLEKAIMQDHDLPPFKNPYRGEPLVCLVRSARSTVASMVSLTRRGRAWLKHWGLPSFWATLESDSALNTSCQSILAGFSEPSERDIAAATLYWKYKTEACRRYHTLGWPVRLVAYEQLVTNPESELTRVCELLEIEWDAGLLKHHECVHTELWSDGRTIGGTDPKRPIDDGSLTKFCGTLTARQLSIVDAVAGNTYADCTQLRDTPTA